MRSSVNGLRSVLINTIASLRRKQFYKNLGSLYAPFFIVLCILLHAGTNAQYYLVAIIGGGAQSLYASSFKNGIAVFPSIGEWYLSIFDYITVIQSSIITVFTFVQSTRRRAVIAAFFASFIVMCLSDVSIMAVEGKLDSNNFFIDILSNLAGFALYAVILSAMMSYHEKISELFLNSSQTFYFYAAGLSVLFSAVLLSGATFFILWFLYQPTAVVVDMIAEEPVSGYLTAEQDKIKLNAAGAFPGGQVAGRLLPLDGVRAHARLSNLLEKAEYTWTNLGKYPYVFSVSFYANCFVPKSIAELPKQNGVVKFDVNKNAKVMFDDGWTEFFADDKMEAAYQIQNIGPSAFWFELGNDKKYKISSFTSKDSTLTAKISKITSYYISAPFIEAGKNKPVRRDRFLSIIVDGIEHKFIFPKKGAVNNKDKSVCKSVVPFSAGSLPKSPMYDFNAGIRVDIYPKNDDVFSTGYQNAQFTITNANGWTYLDGVEKSAIDSEWIGRFSSAIIFGKQAGLTIDGVRREQSIQSDVQVRGEIDGQYTEKGLRLVGTADALWQGSERLNPTRWERLSAEMQITILTALSGIVLLLLRLAVRVWRRTFVNTAIFRFS